MHIFYATPLNTETVTLDEQESQHAVKVLRLAVGTRVMVMDGRGTSGEADIINAHPRRCELLLVNRTKSPPRDFHVHIAIAPTKLNDRMEWFLEKATEIGIEEITPVICDRSERRQVNHDRFMKVLMAAMKQSGNPWLPVLHKTQPLREFLGLHTAGFIAHCMEQERVPLKSIRQFDNPINILIGPEGDFTPAELEMALQHKWTGVSLGKNRLRTETAALVACHTVALIKS